MWKRRRISCGADRQTATFTHGSGRLDLANAIADSNNPLTARVIVNRVWQWHFGRGIVGTPSDFGTRGDPPTHPELLDYLATRFMDEGWSVKKLQRWIMLSNTYQQSSLDRPEARAVDPENKLLWRMNRQRLDYESLRDSILSVAGQLDDTCGRPAIFAHHDSRRSAAHASTPTFSEAASGRTGRLRFRQPGVSRSAALPYHRPAAGSVLMNSPFITEEAKHLTGRREIDSAANDRERVIALYRIVYGRAPAPDEITMALEYIRSEGSKPAKAEAEPAWRYGIATLSENGR